MRWSLCLLSVVWAACGSSGDPVDLADMDLAGADLSAGEGGDLRGVDLAGTDGAHDGTDGAVALGPHTGLDFPSNPDAPTDAYVAFRFANPQDHGLPIWGPGGAGATYLWTYRPRQQPGYYVTMWWSNDGNFLWDNGSSNTFYGGHPYPRGGGNMTVLHDWEIASDVGGDFTVTRSGAMHPLVVDVWYRQALRVIRNGDGSKRILFYIALPSVADSDVIEVNLSAGYGETNPPSPAITFGDSPWYASFQHERMSGVIRGIKIFDKALSEADVLAESAAEGLVTADGAAHVWYANPNPTPDDILDKSNAGHNPVWVDAAHRAKLWTGP